MSGAPESEGQLSYTAPWGRELVVSTMICVVPLLALSIYMSRTHKALWLVTLAFSLLPLAFTITGYQVHGAKLAINRLGWTSTISLQELDSIFVMPHVMAKSVRIIEIGGVYSVSGRFTNAALGRYRAFVTDSRNTVVLRLRSETVVVSPDRPIDFVARISATRQARGETHVAHIS